MKLSIIKTTTIMMFTLSLLFVGLSSVSTTPANNGTPTRVLSGAFGDRIFLLDCLFNTFDGIPCDDVFASSSTGSYVNHGWFSFTGRELGEGAPFRFHVELNGDALRMKRFSLGGGGGVTFINYVIFEPGELPVGSHTISGVWSNKALGTFVATTTLVVSA